MAESSSLFHALFKQSSVGIAVLRPDGTIVRVNPAFKSLMRSAGHADTPASLLSLFPADASRQIEVRLGTLGNEKLTDTFIDYPVMGADAVVSDEAADSPTAWRFDLAVIGAMGDGPILVANIHDVTEQRAAEERLKRARDTAERATRTKSAFLANMSHEIRTPIHTISGMTELLLDTELDEEQLEYAKQVRFSAEVLLSLINDILDFSKIEAGKLSLEVIDFDAAEVTEDAVDLVSLEAHKKGLEVVVEIGPGIPVRVAGDPARLRQIIVNLFNNAVKFTPEGQVVIRVRATSIEDDRANVLFEVIDSGIGIPRDKVARLFRAFSQVDSSTTRRYGGSGLGLSICKSLVEMMGGRIGVRSEEGAGSTFWFTIPFSIHDDAPGDEPICAGRRILIVDDNDAARGAVHGYLDRWGAEVTAATSGDQALELMREAVQTGRGFDAVLVDLVLPGMDGWHLASEINADKLINATALVLMSPAGKMGGDAKMKRLMWFNAYVNKPVRRYELAGALKSIWSAEFELESPDEGSAEAAVPDAVAPHEYRLLVAEDHFVNQQLFQTILEKIGYQVTIANNGREAVERAREMDPHLIFMDVQMPEMNGYEATTRLRLDGFARPIIAVTANALRGEKEKCIEVGMDDYLTKPFKRDDLLPLLDKWLPRDASSAAPGPAASDEEPIEELEPIDALDRLAEEEPDREFAVPEEMVSGALSGPGAPVFDVEAAVQTFMGRRDVVDRVVRDFSAKIEAIIPAIRQAIEEEEFDTVRREAHGLKGGAWNLEARRMGDTAALLEASAKMVDASRCRYYLERLEGVYSEFHRESIELLVAAPDEAADEAKSQAGA